VTWGTLSGSKTQRVAGTSQEEFQLVPEGWEEFQGSERSSREPGKNSEGKGNKRGNEGGFQNEMK
jgi:hypothetical protein